MTQSDPIADFLTRIRNASLARHRYTDIPWSKFKENIAEILKEENLVESYKVIQNKPGGSLRVYLKYTPERRPVIRGLKRVSKPGLRKYVNHNKIPQFFGGLGVAVVSTSSGVLSGEEARKQRKGGELVCIVW
ncbi:MAG: 30S ribosomal protein S8 [Chlamydiales bacterium]